MKAAVCEKYGPPEVVKIREVRDPVLTDGEVLIMCSRTEKLTTARTEKLTTSLAC
jgi:NADPH:quinone reductase-like Zn-dependent oxidoreductase